MDGLVSVYSKTTGKKQRVPEHWVDHPVLGRNLRKTPLSQSRDSGTKSSAPTGGAANTPANGEKE